MNVEWTTAVFLMSVGCISSIPPTDVLDSLRSSTGNGTCDFSDVDAHNMVDAFLSRLPVELTVPDEESHEVIPGVTVGKFAVYSGLNNFRLLGPVQSYCQDGSRFLHVVLDVSRGNIRVTLPWYTCESARGAVGAVAKGKFAVTFQVVKATRNESSNPQGFRLLLHSGPSPLYVESVYAFFEGADPSLESAFKALGMMFTGLVREAWLHYVTPTLHDVFRNSTSLETPSFIN